MKLTEESFWSDYWRAVRLPAEVNLGFSFDRCLAHHLSLHLKDCSGEIFEIGCAPGKWLSYFYKKHNLIPNGVEYSLAGVEATLRNFKLLNIPSNKIVRGDFFKIKPDKKFDVVISLGFIEHFDNVDEVIRLHLEWIKPGGLLILGVPNFSGFNGLIQAVLDKEILDKNNLNIMNLDFFNQIDSAHDVDKVFVDYIGSFEPALAIPKHKFGNPLQFLVRCFLFAIRLLRKIRLFDKLNNRFFSSYILAIYRKKY